MSTRPRPSFLSSCAAATLQLALLSTLCACGPGSAEAELETSSEGDESAEGPDAEALQEVTARLATGRVAWFGFIGIECGTSYASAVSGYTNLSHLCVVEPTQALGPALERLRAHGQKALLHVESILFTEVAGTSPSANGKDLRLRADAQTRWQRFVATNRPLLTGAHVGALYLVDEPTWRGLSPAELSRAIAIVDATHRELPTLAIEAYPSVRTWQIPSALDWVGFDRYFTFDPGTDADWQADYQALRKLRTRADQRIVIALDAQWLPVYGEAGVSKSMMSTVALNYMRVAAKDPDVVAVMGYLWLSGLDEPGQVGAGALPRSVRTTYWRIGQSVLASPQAGR